MGGKAEKGINTNTWGVTERFGQNMYESERSSGTAFRIEIRSVLQIRRRLGIARGPPLSFVPLCIIENENW